MASQEGLHVEIKELRAQNVLLRQETTSRYSWIVRVTDGKASEGSQWRQKSRHRWQSAATSPEIQLKPYVIHQSIFGDGIIGILSTQRLLREADYGSEIYCEGVDRQFIGQLNSYQSFEIERSGRNISAN